VAGGELVFGYGSLVNLASLARALGRAAMAPADVTPARLAGWRRVWTSSDLVVVDGRELRARFLDLAPRAGARVNGVLVRVSLEELASLRVRERGYREHEVTVDGTRAVLFAGGSQPPGVATLAGYLALVEDGFAAFGDAFLAEYRATTDTPPPPIVAGAYRFADAAQNALTTHAPR
jgi:hypothetical protein